MWYAYWVNPTCDGYNDGSAVATIGTSHPACEHGGGLPVTGLDVGLLIACALVLVALGYVLRKTSRR